MEPVNAIELLGVTKRFGEVVANDNVNLTVRKGEILSILGENGSGKTTLMNMLSGIYFPDEGEIRVNGKTVTIRSPKDSFELGIGMIHQHFKLINILTAAENIILGLPGKERLNLKQVEKEVKELTDRYGFDLNPSQKIYDMSVSQKQTVEIVKVLYRGADILILDEPTAVLTPQETEKLFAVLRNMRKAGKSIIIITHKLNEIMAVTDRVTVLHKGKCVGTVNTKDVTKQELSTMMVGRPVQLEINKAKSNPGDVVLSVENLTVPSKIHKSDAVKGVSFNVRKGEIVCIAGIDGNGQTELIYGLTGLEKTTSGTIKLCGTDISHASIRERAQAGMSHIPEDRHKHGLVLPYTLEQNLVLQKYREKQFQNHGFIKFGEVRKYAEKLIEEYDIRSGQGPITVTRSMSGGNQQKAIIARELDRDEPLIIAVQPTRGLDVGAIEHIHGQLISERDKDKAILLVSLELDEVLSLSDRILVMYEGEIVGELDPDKTDAQELGLYMSGAKRQDKEVE